MKTYFSLVKVWILVLGVCLGLVCVTKSVSTMAQEPSQEREGSTIWKVEKVGPKSMRIKAKGPEEVESDRIIEDQMPPGVPLDVEIKNLNTNSLLRDVEIKVTNTAKKPIYFLELGIVLPENLSPAGYPIGFPLRYGRDDLIKFASPLEPGDVPLLPEASLILKIPGRYLAGFERLVTEGQITPGQVKRVYLMFRHLNFGDQTGFSSDGSPVPNIHRERSAYDNP
jgi:hypothetical protein